MLLSIPLSYLISPNKAIGSPTVALIDFIGCRRQTTGFKRNNKISTICIKLTILPFPLDLVSESCYLLLS